jgi:hypothetical protein
MRLLCLAAMASISLAACGPSPAQVAATLNPEPASTCPDDGPRFPVTGLCTGRISNYYDPDALQPLPAVTSPAGKDCQWVFNETQMIDEALIYRALSCDGVTATLEFSAGAHRAGLHYKSSAFFKDAKPEEEMVRIFLSSPQSPLKERIAELPPTERAKCIVRPPDGQGWPKDALVIAYNDDAAQTLPKNEPNAVCGEYGLDEDSLRFWLVRQGYAFFFDLGQDQSDLDPSSFMVFAKDADGNWGPK